jgi:hypothetical protein
MMANGIESPAVELPQYKCHKVVRAAKITAFRQNGNPDMPDLVLGEIGGVVALLPDWHAKHKPHVGGYFVKYEDGYTSFSPAIAFEEGYTLEGSASPPVAPAITGYRNLSSAELGLINEGKALAEQCGAYIAKLRQHPDRVRGGGHPGEAVLDQRWIAIGATDLQRGFMALTRGIAQPTTF